MSKGSLVGEFGEFLKQNRKWWLLPILLVFACFAVILVLGSTVAAPFIYTLF